MNTTAWMDSLKGGAAVASLPIMTHPGIEILGKKIVDAVTDGQVHYESIKVLHECFPQAAAATVIMDLTVEAEAFGAEIFFPEDGVPSVIGRSLKSYADVEALAVPPLDAGRVPQYLIANRLVAENLGKPLFGGCIGPFSLAGRLFDMTEIMVAIYIEPETTAMLLEKCTQFITEYCLAIKATGAAGVIIAEPAAGLLSDEDCMAHSSVYVRRIVEHVQDDDFAVILHNCGNTGHCTHAMTSVGAKAYHFGNKIDMADALAHSPSDSLVMGNLDPVGIFRMMSPAEVAAETVKLLEKCAGYGNFVISTGCDTPPQVPLENIAAFYETVAGFRR